MLWKGSTRGQRSWVSDSSCVLLWVQTAANIIAQLQTQLQETRQTQVGAAFKGVQCMFWLPKRGRTCRAASCACSWRSRWRVL